MPYTNPNSRRYRLLTVWQAFKRLYQMPTTQVDAFLKSYDIYDYDWENGVAIQNGKTLSYDQVKKNIIAWYTVLNHLCAIVEVEKMYIPPVLDLSKRVVENQLLFEKSFAEKINLKKGDKAFELGCGKGLVAAHLAAVTGADITAINIDQGQINHAIAFAKKNKLDKQCHFFNSDFNELPFSYPDAYFDAIYEIQALSLSRDLSKLFAELHRILKPGGRISILEWVKLPKYDENDPHHQELMRRIKPLIGAIGTPSPQEYEARFKDAGFKILVSEDPSINKSQSPLIDLSTANKNFFSGLIKFLVTIKILPSYFITLFDRLGQDVEALCEADRAGLVTTSYHIVAEKL